MDGPADLSRLADIAMPSPVPWWPPAPGWWFLAAAFLAGLVIVAAFAVGRYRRNAYRRAALTELAAVDLADSASAVAISCVLKRVALVAYPRSDVASLTGSAWLTFLDRVEGTSDFTTGRAADLTRAAVGSPVGDSDAILGAARQWVRRHRAAA